MSVNGASSSSSSSSSSDEIDNAAMAKARRDKDIIKAANEQARDIGMYFLQNIEFVNWELEQVEKQRLLSQNSIVLELSSANVSVQITASGTSFGFPVDVLAEDSVDDFCELVQKYKESCTDAHAENLEFTLEGSNPEKLKEVARALYEKQNIVLNKIVVKGQGGGVIEGYDAINKFLNPVRNTM